MLNIDHHQENISDQISVLISKTSNITKGTILHLHELPGADKEQYRDLHELFAPRGYRVISFNYPGLWSAGGSFTIDNAIYTANQVAEYVSSSYEGNSYIFAQSFGAFIANRILPLNDKYNHVFYRAPLPGLEYFLNNKQKKQQLLTSMSLLVQSGVLNVQTDNLEEIIGNYSADQTFDIYVKRLAESGIKQYYVIGKNDEILDYEQVKDTFSSVSTMEIFENLSHNSISRDQWIEIVTRADVFFQT